MLEFCLVTPLNIDNVISMQGILPMWFTDFYGDPDSSQKVHSYELLRRLSMMEDRPWL